MATANRTCVDCGSSIDISLGRGRPRKRCMSCSPSVATAPREAVAGKCPCGDVFKGVRGRKYCSPQCKERYRQPSPTRLKLCSGGCGGFVHVSASSAENPTCRLCRSRVRGHGASGYRRGCRCAECRAGVAEKQREYAQRRATEGRALHQTRKRVRSVCSGCGATFMSRADMVKAGKGKFCAPACHDIFQTSTGRSARDRETRRERGPRGSVRRRALRRAEDALRLTGGNRVWVQGACIICGEQFLSPGAASRYCSVACREKNRANKSYGLSWLDRMALFARDDWTCALCKEPVDYTADPLSDWYPSIDHIVPRSKGGSDDLENLRTCHRWCNSVRGDLSHYTDEELAWLA